MSVFKSIASLLRGRFSFGDILETSSRVPQRVCEAEDGAPDAAEPISPLEILRADCHRNGWRVVDYRDLEEWPRSAEYDWREWGWPPNKKRAQPYGSRSWEKITTVMLHTTDTGPIGHRRGLGMPCHAFIPHDATVVLCHSLTALVAHGHAGNSFSVGVEFSGRCSFDSDSQAERGRAFMRYFQNLRRMQVGEDAPCYVMSHRMSHKSRTRDPGVEVWEQVGQWAIDELGFQLGPVVGSGRPNPERGKSWH